MTNNTDPAGLSSSLPTRKQIAEAINRGARDHNEDTSPYLGPTQMQRVQADAVLALLQKGAERG